LSVRRTRLPPTPLVPPVAAGVFPAAALG